MANDNEKGPDFRSLFDNLDADEYSILLYQSIDGEGTTLRMSKPQDVDLSHMGQNYIDERKPTLMRYTEKVKEEILEILDREMCSVRDLLIAKRVVNSYQMDDERLDELILEEHPLSELINTITKK
jgi:hypothetical protein